MNTPLLRQVMAVAAGVLLLAACNGGGDAAGGEDAAASSATVEIADSAYSPSNVSVPTGGEVTWTNNDSLPHTVTFEDDSLTSSQELAEGDDFSTTFDTAGTFPYVCAIHPEMTGTVTVTEG